MYLAIVFFVNAPTDMNKLNDKRTTTLREKPILLGFATQSKGTNGRIQINFRWGRIILSMLAILVTAWMSVAGCLFFWFKYKKDFEAVSFTGMMTLPFRMDEHRKEMGDFHIEKGLQFAKEGNYRDALRLLRLGVTRSPANLEGRQVLAEFYEFALKRADIAADLMFKGLENGGIDNIDYLRRTLQALLRHQMDDQVQTIADTYLPEEPEISQNNRVIAYGAAQANFLRGDFDRADDYIMSYKLLETIDGILLSADISWERGNKLSAIAKLEASEARFPNAEALMIRLSRYNRELGNIDEARQYAILRNIVSPLSPAPRMELLYIYNESGDSEREKKETRRMLRQFGDDPKALQSLANFAADTGNISLARRTYEEALENEFPINSYALLLIEAHLVSSDYDGALTFAEELLKERPEWLKQHWSIFSSLRAVASYGNDRPDLGDIYLQDFLNEKNTLPQQSLAVARRFNNIERPQQARKVLMKAHQASPSNQKVLSELIRTELVIGNTENLNHLITRLLQMRRPQMELLLEAYNKLGSDLFIFTPDRESLLLQLSAILRENSQALQDLSS